jgi:hypothetical protein
VIPPGLRKGLQPRCNVHPIAEEIAPMNNDVADVNADTESQVAIVRHGATDGGKPLLNGDRALNCAQRSWKLCQQAVTGHVGNPTTMPTDQG